MLRTHTCGELSGKDDGVKTVLAGWVDSLRIGGKIGFLHLRDRYGKTQVFLNAQLAKEFRTLNREDIILVRGTVQARPAQQVKGPGTGEIEVVAHEIEILKEVPPLPVELDESIASTEETRLTYRYIDLRRERMQRNLQLRHAMIKAVREYLDAHGFLEIETPILAKSTPEGARDYIVPSRKFPGEFFALPQSPQTFKQLLMVAGYDRYFQIARCFRDEDLRADRQPEFTQLDVEMSFVEEEDIYTLFEGIMKEIFKDVFKYDLPTPFPRLSYKECQQKYHSDKPDLRTEQGTGWAFLWITDFPMFEFSEEENRFVAMHHPFTSPHKDDLHKIHTHKQDVRSRSYDLVLNGFELGSGSIRIHDSTLQAEVFKAVGLSEKEARQRFGFLLDALKFAPPHGGFAIGLDRLAALLAGEETIREVIAFPKNKDARDLMLDAPSEIRPEQLKEAHISLKSS